ncbi:hypothetical protein BRC91_08255 [Halobacteriales archaeon QS_4_62_28]|nr:MAG: hypothetical protein BRC91_08255 [Halobacteriales archaeon QS_4_62_28]
MQLIMSQQNSFEKLEEFLERMSGQFDQSGRPWDLRQFSPMEASGSIDLADTGEEFVALVDVPGFEKDDIDVRITDQTLQIDAEYRRKIEAESANYLQQERTHESVSRRITLPNAVDVDAVDARLDNGVLRVTIGKAEAAESGQPIEIE